MWPLVPPPPWPLDPPPPSLTCGATLGVADGDWRGRWAPERSQVPWALPGDDEGGDDRRGRWAPERPSRALFVAAALAWHRLERKDDPIRPAPLPPPPSAFPSSWPPHSCGLC